MEDNDTVIHTSKFDALAELDERKNKPKNKATSSTQGDTNNFVKIVSSFYTIFFCLIENLF